jgi:3-deoxy-7-phosphoheptulonate synthase
VDDWHEARVPCTVLCALVKDGTYPDPRVWPHPFRIPDSSDAFNGQHDLARYSHLPEGRNPWRDPWWYRAEFDLPSLQAGQRVWLTLNSINYRADVWVSGRQIADREQLAGEPALAGMFQRFRLDLTDQVQAGTNALAILVYPVDHPGDPDTQLEVFGPVRDFRQDICHDVTEVMSIGHVELVGRYADVIQIGARNMHNFMLLSAAGKAARPVLLKRGWAATMDELLFAAEYIIAAGNEQVILCERGIRTFEDHTRNTLSLATVPALKQVTHLPVMVDPSHGTGHAYLVAPMCRAAVACGADGLLVEVHPDPEHAASDGAQSLTPEAFAQVMAEVARLAEAVDRSL